MFEKIYELRISGNDITVDYPTWEKIRDYARNHKLFYVVYKSKVYRYTHAQTYMERPTRFDFEQVQDDEKDIIEYIYIE